jgi:hypothetical protein
MGKEPLRDPRVLGEHRRRRGEHAQRPEGDVAQIADRGRHDVKAGGKRLGLGREAEGGEHAGARARLLAAGAAVDSVAHGGEFDMGTTRLEPIPPRMAAV